MKILSTLCLTLIMATSSAAEDPELAKLFAHYQVKGTLVLSSLDGEEFVHNKVRAHQGFLPASTFKIPNTLIALEEGVVTPDEVSFKWDGKKKYYRRWNQDHTLASAYQVSCVWCYQELARKIGDASYKEHLAKLQYGNLETGPELTRFWLDGDIRISAWQQVDFLKRLYQEQIPYKKKHFGQLKAIMLAERGEGHAVYAKTGWAVGKDFQYGWYVGYLEKQNQSWFFALNMETHGKADLKLREQLVMEGLKLKKLL